MASHPHGSSSSSRLELPAEIMQQIVQHLSLQDRLVSCALISTAWAAAAAAAPVRCVDLVQRKADSLAWQRCLAKLNCQQLTSVRLAVDDLSSDIRHSLSPNQRLASRARSPRLVWAAPGPERLS